MTDSVQPKRRALLAEDHPLNQRVTTVMLEQLGYLVDVVADGAEAVRAATQAAYQVIFMDCQIPVLDGYRATAAIRLHRGPSWRAPIVAVTASGEEANRQRCLDAGMDDYLTKPLSMKTLAAVLARVTPVTLHELPDAVVGADTHGAAAPPGDVVGRPALDAQIVARLERLGDAAGQDLFGQLTALFLADAGTLLAALRDALDRRDAAAVADAAHRLGGASANLGATELAGVCARLSANGANGSSIDDVEAEVMRVCEALGASVLTP